MTPPYQRAYLEKCSYKPILYYPQPNRDRIEGGGDPIGSRATLEDYMLIGVHPKHHIALTHDSIGLDIQEVKTADKKQIIHNFHMFGFTEGKLQHYHGDALLYG
jgi:hypothetical protein